ncbi:hypothetical protein PACILC2_24330 [Paenibacillus cisolokensis]|uniref:HTH luxR-type domain-containing protein n=1 Tax=Paenibacillus cisolokensis TaxID=1658519 RepID=A0ABQ4N6P8_9BACL|nr:hypothetical protein PACILC2_24330 [Paenibacillus cisolokensis]
MQKLEAANRIEAITIAREKGWIVRKRNRGGKLDDGISRVAGIFLLIFNPVLCYKNLARNLNV